MWCKAAQPFAFRSPAAQRRHLGRAQQVIVQRLASILVRSEGLFFSSRSVLASWVAIVAGIVMRGRPASAPCRRIEVLMLPGRLSAEIVFQKRRAAWISLASLTLVKNGGHPRNKRDRAIKLPYRSVKAPRALTSNCSRDTLADTSRALSE